MYLSICVGHSLKCNGFTFLTEVWLTMNKNCVPDEHCLTLLSFWSASLSGLRNSQTDPRLSCSHGCTFSAPDCSSQAFWKAVKETFYKELNVQEAWAIANATFISNKNCS